MQTLVVQGSTVLIELMLKKKPRQKVQYYHHLYSRKLRYKMDKELVLGYTASKCGAQIQTISSEFVFLTITLHHISRERPIGINSQ